MAKKSNLEQADDRQQLSFAISTKERPEFKEALSALAFNESGELIDSSPVRDGKVTISVQGRRTRVFVAPTPTGDDEPTLSLMKRINAFEPVLQPGMTGPGVDSVTIPGGVLDFWPLCGCLIRGKVVRNINGHDRPVCGARVHVCEVDQISRWIVALTDPDIFRLRDDLIKVIDRPPIPLPDPPRPGPRPPIRLPIGPKVPGLPVPGPRELSLSANVGSISTRSVSAASTPALKVSTADVSGVSASPEFRAALSSTSASVVRQALAANPALIFPYLCLWPHWWNFRCDEIAVISTDAFGRFQRFWVFPCSADKPDLYFWVEYQIGGSWETVYKPPIPCFTHWNYVCGTDVTIHVTDQRVPTCGDDEGLSGCQVAVLSIGNNVAVREVQSSGAGEGLVDNERPLGGNLEPHVWFGKQCLFAKNITKYRWSYRKVGTPGWTIMDHEVGRHYAVVDPATSDLSFPYEPLGPDAGNRFRIKPVAPPAPGLEWFVINARTDTATAFFETNSLVGGNVAIAAGKYEIKLELFKTNGALVDWTTEGIALKVPEVGETAPFAPDTLNTENAPAYYRVIDPGNGHTMGFRMVLHVDNNQCTADIFAVTGAGLSVDPACGFIHYTPGSSATLTFEAHHPNGFATFGFNVTRGLNGAVAVADSGGKVGDSPLNGYTLTGINPHIYEKTIPVASLLGACPSAAFSEVVDLDATATDGWSRLTQYDASDSAAFALDVPCPPCDCE